MNWSVSRKDALLEIAKQVGFAADHLERAVAELEQLATRESSEAILSVACDVRRQAEEHRDVQAQLSIAAGVV